MTAHCLLVSANRVTTPYPVYPIGIAYLISALSRAGHTADHVDILASGGFADLRQKLQSTTYDIIGVSIRNIDTVDSATPTEMLGDITEAIQCIRQFSTAPLILGGPGFSIMPDRLIAYYQADYGIVGEGEEAFPELIEQLMAGRYPKGKLFCKALKAYPNCQPTYSTHVTPYYVQHGGMLNVQTKRGCCYRCAYCSYPAIEGKRMRQREPENIVEEIASLRRDFGAKYIFFTDAVFNDPDDHYLKVAEALIRAGNKTPWCAFFRPQNLGKDRLRLLKRSGMVAMELGTDATTDSTLTGLNKGFSFEEVVQTQETIVSESLASAHFVMFGGPEETRTTFMEGLKNLERLRHAVVFAYVGIRILPNTKIFDRAIDDQIINKSTDLIPPTFYYSPHVQRDFIDSNLRRVFHGKQDRLYPVAKSEMLLPVFHRRGNIGPLWDLLINKHK